MMRKLLGVCTVLSLWSCGSSMQTQDYVAVSTAAPGIENPEATYVVHVSAKQNALYRGDVSTDQLQIQVDPTTKTVKLKGKVKLKNSKTHKVKEATVELTGQYNKDGIATLVPTSKDQDLAPIKVRSKPSKNRPDRGDSTRTGDPHLAPGFAGERSTC